MATKVLSVLSYLPVLLVIFLDIITAYYCIEQMIFHPVFLDVKIMGFVVMSLTLGAFTWFVVELSKDLRNF